MLDQLINEKIYRIFETIKKKYYYNEDKIDVFEILTENIFKTITDEDRDRVEKVRHRIVEQQTFIQIKMKLIGDDYCKEFEFPIYLGKYSNVKNNPSQAC